MGEIQDFDAHTAMRDLYEDISIRNAWSNRESEQAQRQNNNLYKRVEILESLVAALIVHAGYVPPEPTVEPKTEPGVKATCYTWGGRGTVTAQFDCRLWLEEATDIELVALLAEGTTGNPSVGEYYKTTLTKEVFDHLKGEESTNTKVHPGQLYEWICANRPHLLRLGVRKPKIDIL